MYSRDPFNLRRTSSTASQILRASPSSHSRRTFETSQQTGQAPEASPPVDFVSSQERNYSSEFTTNAPIMTSYGLPPNGNMSQSTDVRQTGRSRTHETPSASAIGEKVTSFFAQEKGELPMYKDKPYRRGGKAGKSLPPWMQERKSVAAIIAGLLLVIWVLRLLTSTSTAAGGSKSKSYFGGSKAVNWDMRADKVKEVFQISWADYQQHGWGMLRSANDIRVPGLAFSLTYFAQFPGKYAPVKDDISDDMYIEKAVDLAERLLGAYETSSGVPLASVNLQQRRGIPSHADGGASSTAEATTVQLEMKYISKLTGETHYWEKAEKVMKVIDDNHPADNLVPIFIYADQGTFRGNTVRLGSRGDSYYEYLAKQYLQTSGQEPIYETMWNESLAGVKKHLITYSYPHNFTVLAERPDGLHNNLSPKMDHLVCFYPGTMALAVTGGLTLAEARKLPTWSQQKEEDMRLAEELMKTCMGMYKTTATGLAPEIAHFNIHNPPLMYNDFPKDAKPKSPDVWGLCPKAPCSTDAPPTFDEFIVKPADTHNLQRPETVESLFYMWRITGNEVYRTLGWEMFEAFLNHTVTPDGKGFSSLSSVVQIPPPLRDNMESFWMAETLKYFYLLFSSNDILPLTDVVFNTEAHPMPRFELGKLFKTGWQRGGSKDKSQPAVRDDGDAPADAAKFTVTKTVLPEMAATSMEEAADTLRTDLATSTEIVAPV
ncbi:hypothetical protein MRB53_039482 [Persea americana]|nr:hypothetical protein MRB53_039482 [Persea americana]